MFNPQTTPYALFPRAIEAAQKSFAVTTETMPVHDGAEPEHAIIDFASTSNGGLIVLPDICTISNCNSIISLAKNYRLLAIYPFKLFAVAGGLVSYGSDDIDVFRRAASYVDLILKGKNPGRSSGTAGDEIRAGGQFKDRRGARLDHPGIITGERRRTDRMMLGNVCFRQQAADIGNAMRRRDFLKAMAGAATAGPLGVRAQTAAGKIQRIGIIDDSPSGDPFRQQLRELNYVEGQNLAYVYVGTDSSPDQLDAAAMSLAQLPVNVIAAFGTPRAKAAQRATKTIPIVAISISDPRGSGLVTSLAHPAGNITGNTILGPDIVTKKLQILKDAIPTVARIAYLWNPENSATAEILEDLRMAAPLFHMTVTSLAARTTLDFGRVLAQMSSDRPDAVLLTSDPAHQAQMPAVINFLLKNRIPGLFQTREHVVAGGLMCYGVSLSDLFRMGALYTDKILRGTSPGDLPIAQPVTFEFVINLKTAKAIGIEIPAMVLALADEVIE